MFILSHMTFENASRITSRGGLLAETSGSIKNKEESLIYSLKGEKSLNVLQEIILKIQTHKIIKKNPIMHNPNRVIS